MSKVWIYQANRKLQDAEVQKASNFLQSFVSQWKAHGTQLQADFALLHNLFVVIEVDETRQPATGCSIDESVHAIKELGETLGVNFFDRQRVAFKIDEAVDECSLQEFKKLWNGGKIDENTPVFDNTITNGEAWRNAWMVPLGESWHKRLVAK